MHARRYFIEAEPSDPRAVEAPAFIRTLYTVERELNAERARLGEHFTDGDAANWRQARVGPILTRFADWLEVQHRSATPKSFLGQAIEYSRNQWASLVRYLDDAQFDIDNGAAERAIRPLAIGRSNWLHVGGDGGVKDGLAAPERLRQRDPARAQPVGVPPRRARRPHNPLYGR